MPIDLFLDSGAYSAFSKGVEIGIEEYIQFVKDNLPHLGIYANLDVIGDAEATLKNQRKMEDAGLSPIPTYHIGEPERYLKMYVSNYDYIALGGMAPYSTSPDLPRFLDRCFEIICGKDGLPKCKVHGFAVTSIKHICRYPWFSCDSTAWVQTSRFGGVFIPSKRQGEYAFDDSATKISISNRSPLEKAKSDSIEWLRLHKPSVFEQTMAYFQSLGLPLGMSRIRSEKPAYKLNEDEKWFSKPIPNKHPISEYRGMRLVEEILEPGLCNDFHFRDEANIKFFLALEASRPAWPWAWTHTNINGAEVVGKGRIKAFDL